MHLFFDYKKSHKALCGIFHLRCHISTQAHFRFSHVWIRKAQFVFTLSIAATSSPLFSICHLILLLLLLKINCRGTKYCSIPLNPSVYRYCFWQTLRMERVDAEATWAPGNREAPLIKIRSNKQIIKDGKVPNQRQSAPGTHLLGNHLQGRGLAASTCWPMMPLRSISVEHTLSVLYALHWLSAAPVSSWDSRLKTTADGGASCVYTNRKLGLPRKKRLLTFQCLVVPLLLWTQLSQVTASAPQHFSHTSLHACSQLYFMSF